MRKQWLSTALILTSVLAFLFSLGMVFLYAPTEVITGDVQRIFYFHVASAWVGFFGFFVTAISGAIFLAKNDLRWDTFALGSAEIGLAFITMTVITGMLWAKPVWGVFWTWEPRLTISAVQWLIYIAYVMLRRAVDGRERVARFSAVYGILAFITVPLSWFAIRWWRTLHPLILSDAGMAITPRMQTTLFAALGAFTLLYVALMYHRVHLERCRDELAVLRDSEELAA